MNPTFALAVLGSRASIRGRPDIAVACFSVLAHAQRPKFGARWWAQRYSDSARYEERRCADQRAPMPWLVVQEGRILVDGVDMTPDVEGLRVYVAQSTTSREGHCIACGGELAARGPDQRALWLRVAHPHGQGTAASHAYAHEACVPGGLVLELGAGVASVPRAVEIVSTPAALIRKARKAAGLTQAAIAAQVGVSVATVARWESGAIDPPSSELLRVDPEAPQSEGLDAPLPTPTGP